jgi:hypothetical protein
MGALSDALQALKKVILIEENVSRLQKDVVDLAGEVRRTRDYAGSIDQRVARIEGVLQGAAMARGGPPALPEE